MQKLHLYIVLSFLTFAVTAPALAADEKHPTIHHAIVTLEATKDELEKGEHGFGGHRSAAIEHIDAALKELHQALEYADAHPGAIHAP
jgi:hypothetical protein